MKIGTVRKNFQNQEVEVHLEIGPLVRAAVWWVFVIGTAVLVGASLERAYLLTRW